MFVWHDPSQGMLYFAKISFQNYKKHRLDCTNYLFGPEWLEDEINTAPRRVGSFLKVDFQNDTVS